MTGVAGTGPIFMGVDGGGSRCRTRLRDANGEMLATVTGGAANVYLDFEGAIATVWACISETLKQAGLPASASARLRLGLGLAGASSPAVARQVEARLLDFFEVRVVNDAVTACIGAHGGADGGLVVVGTGSVGVARVSGRVTLIGGRGFVLGDDGSGARIGLEAWRRALLAHDGLGAASDLTRQLMARFGGDPAAVIAWGLHAPSHDYAAYAPTVFAAAADGDRVALDVVGQAATSIERLIAALHGLGAERIALVGGLAVIVRPYLTQSVAASLSRPTFDALEGGILLVGGMTPSARACFGPEAPA